MLLSASTSHMGELFLEDLKKRFIHTTPTRCYFYHDTSSRHSLQCQKYFVELSSTAELGQLARLGTKNYPGREKQSYHCYIKMKFVCLRRILPLLNGGTYYHTSQRLFYFNCIIKFVCHINVTHKRHVL